jgi:tetratricopeptide (TPR) repeat protein/CBS domain-containing protein
MGAAFAGIIRVPLTSVIMIFEVTRDYSIIVPLMIANLISYYISSKLQEEPIYEALQHQDGVYLPEGARERQDVVLVGRAVRPITAILKAEDKVEAAFASLSGDQSTWAVVGKGGLLGMVTKAQLQHAMENGRGSQSLAALALSGEATGRPGYHYPYVHTDHSLDTAMRLMAQTGIEVLPVVSRTNLRELIGVVTLPEMLNAYGFGSSEKTAVETHQELKAPVAKLAMVVTAIVGLLLVAVSLNYYYRTQRSGRALKSFQAGNELVQADRYQEAIEQYRNALSITHSDENRLALGLALVKAHRSPEAEIYLREVLRDHPTSGPANIGLAEAYAAQSQFDAAVTCYHQAIYGAWPDHPAEHRVQTRMELVKTLGTAGRYNMAQAELLAILPELPADPAIRKPVAGMLFDFGLYRECADLYRSILQRDKNDTDAYARLGDAEVARWNYAAARDAFNHVLAIRPLDEPIKERLKICDQVLAMDPTMAGLRPGERYRRIQNLLSAVLTAQEQCQTSHPEIAVPGPLATAVDAARKQLAQHRRPASYADAADDNLSLVKQLWAARPQACKSPSDDAAGRIMAHLLAH